jgi:hypothetical protein
MRRFSLGLLFLASTASGTVNAANPESGGIRLYSDICYHVEAGDVLGTRIAILNLEDGPYVLYQEAQGDLGQAQIVRVDRKDIANSKLIFSIQDDGKSETFRGSITAERITGRFDDNRTGVLGNAIFKLNRVMLPHRGFPDCR